MTAADESQSVVDDAARAGAVPLGNGPGQPADGTREPVRGQLVDWILVALITLLTAWAAVLGIAFLPLYLGSVPFPVSALLGVGAMILGPRACYALTGSMPAALAPVVSWFGVSVALVLSRNALINLPVTVYQAQWRVMVLLGLGSLAAAATVGLIWGDRLRERIAAERPTTTA